MAAWRNAPAPRQARRSTKSVGQFSITSPGISERVNTSAPGLGSALSKANTLATRLQRELKAAGPDEDDITITITPLGGDPVGRVVVRRDVIETFA